MTVPSALADRIAGAVDAATGELVEATARAVQIPSITPNFPGVEPADHLGRESEVSALVAELLEDAGAEIDRFAVAPGRENCVGVLHGRGGGRSLILNGHVDVVPPQPAEVWTGADPFSGRVTDGRIFGRGACDMKGGLMAEVFAVRALVAAGIRLRGDLILQAVVGEEMMEHEIGTTGCLRRGPLADGAVVAEPSAGDAPLAVSAVTAGLLWCAVTVRGLGTHAGMRSETVRPGGRGAAAGVNAIDKAFLVHRALSELEQEWIRTKESPTFPPGSFTIHAGAVIGGPAGSLVPFGLAEYVTLECIVWHDPLQDADAVRREIEAAITAATADDPWLRDHPPEVVWKHRWPAAVIDLAHPLIAAAAAARETATGRAAPVRGFPAVADTSYLIAAGVPAVTCGPGDIAQAHAIDEHVQIDELLAATRTYALLAADWCSTA